AINRSANGAAGKSELEAEEDEYHCEVADVCMGAILEEHGWPSATGVVDQCATNVRYASACRRRSVHSTPVKCFNECPIRFSLSSSLRTLNAGEMASTSVRYASACRRCSDTQRR